MPRRIDDDWKERRTLLAAVHELHSILDKLPRDIENLLNLVGHYGGCRREE